MRIVASPDLSRPRSTAKGLIDRHFASQVDPLKIEAHRRKREEALEAIARGGETAGPLLSAEANRMGVSVLVLAEDILRKPDTLVAVENARRARVEALKAASNLSEIHEVLKSVGIDPAVLSITAQL